MGEKIDKVKIPLCWQPSMSKILKDTCTMCLSQLLLYSATPRNSESWWVKPYCTTLASRPGPPNRFKQTRAPVVIFAAQCNPLKNCRKIGVESNGTTLISLRMVQRRTCAPHICTRCFQPGRQPMVYKQPQ
jgi:hypothetical protein